LTNGTPYQSALATAHFLVFQQSQRLATISAGRNAAETLTKQVLGLSSPVPKAVSEQHVEPNADLAQIARTALASKPDSVYFAGPAETSGKQIGRASCRESVE